MPSPQEKAAFTRRLRERLDQRALKQRAFHPNVRPIKGATELARQFNLRHAEDTSISPQAAHKWLNGQAIPKADKLKTLAGWLGVSEHWLHYGPPPKAARVQERNQEKPQAMPSLQTLALAKQIETLPEHQRDLIAEIVRQFDEKQCAGH